MNPDLFSGMTSFSKNLFRQMMLRLLVAAVILPMGIVFLFAFGRLFLTLGDPVSSAVLDWLALGAGLFWFLCLISLLFCTVIVLLNEKPDTEEEEE